jgi:NAD(P)-dependent dehydrogenase (short-subunit alcohol dehydrogenase family)
MTSAAIVTGASSGIGQGAAQRLHQDFDVVLGVDLNESPTPGIDSVIGDVTNPDVFEGVSARLGDAEVGCVVHCAGVTHVGALFETSSEELMHLLRVNVLGTHNVVRAALPLVRSGGAIVVVSSQLAHRPTPGRGAYGASKAAVERMVFEYGAEAATRGVRVVAIAPGPVYTAQTAPRFDQPQKLASVVAKMPFGRLCGVGEIAQAIAFLVSDAASAVVGTTLVADGGYLTTG